MDAATLYTVMSLASGPKRMTTRKFPTMAICNSAAAKLRLQTPYGAKAVYYCVKRKEVGTRQETARPKPKAPAAAKGMPQELFSGTP